MFHLHRCTSRIDTRTFASHYFYKWPSQVFYFFFTRLYANVTSLTVSGSDLDNLMCEIKNHLLAVYKWLCSNKLTLYLTKTKYLIFMPCQKENYNLYPPSSVVNVHLEKSSFMSDTLVCILTVTSLGVTIYIDYICGKISKNINIMVKLKQCVPKATLISLYYSLIYP